MRRIRRLCVRWLRARWGWITRGKRIWMSCRLAWSGWCWGMWGSSWLGMKRWHGRWGRNKFVNRRRRRKGDRVAEGKRESCSRIYLWVGCQCIFRGVGRRLMMKLCRHRRVSQGMLLRSRWIMPLGCGEGLEKVCRGSDGNYVMIINLCFPIKRYQRFFLMWWM